MQPSRGQISHQRPVLNCGSGASVDRRTCRSALGVHGPIAAIGLKAGPLSQWLHRGLTEAELETVLMETRQVKGAFKAMPIKTDRRGAEGIA